MKRVGLVTTYRIDNYGTKLQAYALLKAISKKGYETEIIDYYPLYDKRPKVIVKKIITKILKGLKGENVSIKHKEYFWQERHKAINSFDKYYNKSVSIKGYGKLKSIVINYDCIVCGSDQIWSEGNLITDYFNLTFVNGRRKTIAYAPSFGTSNISEFNQKKYTKFLKKIDHISVRETSGVELVRQLTGRSVKQVLDPTILVGCEVWDQLLEQENNKIVIDEDYIFCYFLGDNERHRKVASQLAVQTQLMLVSLPHMKKINRSDEEMDGMKLYNVSPINFIYLIKHANYVCTDSFHGTVFSIIYNKQFMAFERFSERDKGSTNTRIYSLLNMLDISDRIVSDDFMVYKKKINYKCVNEKLQNLRKESDLYLENALKASCEKERKNE